MSLAYFIDRAGVLGKLAKTPQGGSYAPATISRVGVMPYLAGAIRKQGGTVPVEFADSDFVRIYTPAAVLEAAADSLRNAPVTNEHPAKMVTPENYRSVSAGTVLDSSVAFTGSTINGQLAVQDAQLLTDIELGVRRMVSAGYAAMTDYTPGVTDDGLEYDGERTKIIYNHVAIVTRGRAGAMCSIALDSEDIPQDEVPVAIKLKIKGKEVVADEAQAVIDSAEAVADAAVVTLTAAKDAAEAKVKELETKLAEAVSDAALDARVAAKAAEAAKVKAEADKLLAVKDAYPGVELEGKHPTFIDGLFEAAKLLKKSDPDGLKALRGVTDAADPKVARKLSAKEQCAADRRAAAIKG